ncbi:MAG TPA: STAS domain-containing protein [Verrucomicrobiae bacterium]|nr:STAS domain-containing protein [Verrucomicrobiae bacterium]
MEITKQPAGEKLLVHITGRLDAYWSDHLTKALGESVREGFHQLQLDLSRVDYLSSAGIRVLIQYYKQLKSIGGALTVVNPSESVMGILDMAGLSAMLKVTAAAPAPAKAAAPERMETETAIYHVHDQAPGATLTLKLHGDPLKLADTSFTAADCRNLLFPDGTFGLGLGAFGSDFEDCKERFGEFLAVAGAAAYLPTDDTNVPDYMVSEEALVPEVKALYALAGQGQFAKFIRFDAKPEPPGVLPLSDIVNQAMAFAGGEDVAFAMVAEAAGLVGAALKRSAIAGKGQSPFSFPAVRDWLAYTSERAYQQTLAVVVGIACRGANPKLAPFVRPLCTTTSLHGHFHAAVFPYRPLQRGELNLHTTINGLFTSESVQGLLHLMADEENLNSVGQSEFLRGACWVGPLSEITPAAS